jgi:hypothetical protein
MESLDFILGLHYYITFPLHVSVGDHFNKREEVNMNNLNTTNLSMVYYPYVNSKRTKKFEMEGILKCHVYYFSIKKQLKMLTEFFPIKVILH